MMTNAKRPGLMGQFAMRAGTPGPGFRPGDAIPSVAVARLQGSRKRPQNLFAMAFPQRFDGGLSK